MKGALALPVFASPLPVAVACSRPKRGKWLHKYKTDLSGRPDSIRLPRPVVLFPETACRACSPLSSLCAAGRCD